MSTTLTTKEWLTSEDLTTKVSQAMPNRAEIDRFMRCLFTQVQRTPKLMQCTRDSMFSCIIQCAQLGIQPDGRRAHLIPYKETATLIIDYKGLVELVLGSGKVTYVHADIVCAEDDFQTDIGRVQKHVINWKGDRGEPFAAYAIAKLTSGDYLCEVMQRAEIEKIKKSSKSAGSGPWVDFPMEMWKKTVFRRLCKWLPLTPEIKRAIDLDDEWSFKSNTRNVTPPMPPESDESEAQE